MSLGSGATFLSFHRRKKVKHDCLALRFAAIERLVAVPKRLDTLVGRHRSWLRVHLLSTHCFTNWKTMTTDMLELQIAAAPVCDAIPKDKTLLERLQFAMRYVREHSDSLFWMTGRATDDTKFRTALAGVMLAGNDEDRDAIEHSMKPLKMLSAMMQGIPVDIARLEDYADAIPLMKMWHESEKP